MTKSSVALRRLTLASVAMGALAIVVGNSQIAMGLSVQTQSIGYAVRYVGLVICTMTATLFLAVRMGARLKAQAQRMNPARASAKLTNASGPSLMLVALTRSFCMLLFFLGTFSLVSSASAFINWGLGRFRFGGIQFVVYSLFPPAVLLVSGLLIWFMMNVIVRMSQQLDEIAGKVARAQQRIDQLQATDPADSSP